MRVILNNCIGGFSLSEKALRRLAELRFADAEQELGKLEKELANPGSWEHSYRKACEEDENIGRYVGAFLHHIPRDHPLLLQVFDELGPEASGQNAELTAVEIPDDVGLDKGGPGWYVYESEMGYESVHERHRIWSPPKGSW